MERLSIKMIVVERALAWTEGRGTATAVANLSSQKRARSP